VARWHGIDLRLTERKRKAGLAPAFLFERTRVIAHTIRHTANQVLTAPGPKRTAAVLTARAPEFRLAPRPLSR